MARDTWRCVDCGRTYGSRPETCKNCGSPVLDPIGPMGGGTTRTAGRVAGDAREGGDADRWVCEQCGRAHDFEPITCVTCGSTDVTRADREAYPPTGLEIPPGFPTSPEAVRLDARHRELDNPIVLREVLLLVGLCVGFLVGLTLFAL